MNSKSVLVLVIIISNISLLGYLAYDRYQLERHIASLKALLDEREAELERAKESIFKVDLQTVMKIKESVAKQFLLIINLLKKDYDSLNLAYQLEIDLKIGNSLTSFYDALRDKYGPTGAADHWAAENYKVEFAANLAIHDLQVPSWTAIEKEYFARMGEHSYEAAWEKLQVSLSATGIEYEDTPVRKIEKILRFLYHHITYEDEVDDIYRAPVETLSLGSGDSDDYSILAAALLEAAGIESAIGSFKNDEGKTHFMVLVHIEDLGSYDFLYSDDFAHLGLRPDRWIIIEPQTTIEYQGDEKWMSQWRIEATAEIESIFVEKRLRSQIT
jgi:hypothetical protein